MKSIALLAALALAAGTAHASQTVNTKYCDVFQNAGFQGEWMRIQSGKSVNLKNNKTWNDKISSITVGKTCVAEMWADADFTGRHIVVQAGRYGGLKTWNDQITSMKCTCDVQG